MALLAAVSDEHHGWLKLAAGEETVGRIVTGRDFVPTKSLHSRPRASG